MHNMHSVKKANKEDRWGERCRETVRKTVRKTKKAFGDVSSMVRDFSQGPHVIGTVKRRENNSVTPRTTYATTSPCRGEAVSTSRFLHAPESHVLQQYHTYWMHTTHMEYLPMHTVHTPITT
jgi:hypothetical protein